MATTPQRCTTCRRTMIKVPGLQYETCPVCQTVSLFNSNIKGRLAARLGQYVNRLVNQDDLQRQPHQTLSPPQ